MPNGTGLFNNIESGVIGAIAGFFVAIITALGLRRRVEKVEEKTDEMITKTDFNILIEDLKEDMSYLRNRIDKIYDRLV